MGDFYLVLELLLVFAELYADVEFAVSWITPQGLPMDVHKELSEESFWSVSSQHYGMITVNFFR
jgi:hypothetical protein